MSIHEHNNQYRKMSDATPNVYEVLETVSKAKTKATKVKRLKEGDSTALRTVLLLNYHDGINLVPFKAADYNATSFPTSSLYEEYKRLGKVTDGGGKLDGTEEQVRQEYVKILSSIHRNDAEVVVMAGQGNLDDKYKVGLPAVKAAFPELDFE